MKREAKDHPKFKLLARDLKLPLCFVRGIIESIWLETSVNWHRGDIGNWSNDEIAIAIDYPGDADELIRCLLKRHLLDPLPGAGRLYVHDWHEHAPNEVRINLVGRSLRFANGARALPNQHLRIPGSTKRTRRRDRISLAGGEVNRQLRDLILRRDNFRCLGCDSDSDLTIDHVKPVSVGGTTQPWNLQTLCRRCNASKKDRVEVFS